MRRDASERREALLDAAAQCFMEDGYLVPLERIAERAGVGRGTLYRNFQDRSELALELFRREIEQIQDRLDMALPFREALAHFVRASRHTTLLYVRLVADLPFHGEGREAFEALAADAERRTTPFVTQWRERGILDPGISPMQLLLTMRMLSMLALNDNSDAKLASGIDLVMRGLTPRPAGDEPDDGERPARGSCCN